MSTNNDKRPSIDSTKFSLSKLFTEIRNNIRSLRQGLLLASISSLILGFIDWKRNIELFAIRSFVLCI